MTTSRAVRGGPRQVRIIGGVWKRTPLAVANAAGLRPTPDRVRETLYNWLQHLRPRLDELAGLDLFAGTGALGFELASRGARAVTLVESNAAALEQLRALRARSRRGRSKSSRVTPWPWRRACREVHLISSFSIRRSMRGFRTQR